MKNTPALLTTFMAMLLLAACLKSYKDKGKQADIRGNWVFTGMRLQTINTTEYNDGTDILKTLTVSNCRTVNNGGTLHISTDTIACDSITYAIDTTAKAWIFENKKLTDSVTSPFRFTLPPIKITVAYRWAGADSIYFNGAPVFGAKNSLLPPKLTGARLQLEGNRLIVTSLLQETGSRKNKTLTESVSNRSIAVITFEKADVE